MTNYEMIREMCPNADPSSLAVKARYMYNKRMATPTNLMIKGFEDTFERWIFEEADVALKFNVGQLVKLDGDKNTYGTVVRHWQSNMGGYPITMVVVSTVDGEKEYPVAKVLPTDVPLEILELAKAQLRREQSQKHSRDNDE